MHETLTRWSLAASIALLAGGCNYLTETTAPDDAGAPPTDDSTENSTENSTDTVPELDGGPYVPPDYVPPDFGCHLDFEDQTEIVETDAGVLTLVGEAQQTSILFIFDKSSSMWSEWGTESTWEAANGALIGAITTSNELLGGQLDVGGILFPLPDGCLVLEMSSGEQMDFAAAGEFLAGWEDAVQKYQPNGTTPLGEAFRVADRLLVKRCNQGKLDHLLKILVLTDGMPNCDQDGSAWTSFPARWLDAGIKTYVFGLPGSNEAAGTLDDIAEAGGTGAHIAPYKELPDGGLVESDAGTLGEDIAVVVC